MPTKLGKRYQCSVCGAIALWRKAGEGDPKCCNTILEVQEPRNLPSSD